MSEKEWAKYYQENKDDPEVWGESEEDVPPRSGGLNATITVRFSSEEAADLRELARELDASYSEIVRLAVRKFVQFRIAAGKAERVESEEGQELSLSNATTITSSAGSHV